MERCCRALYSLDLGPIDQEGRFSTNDYMGAIRVYGTYVVAPILDWFVHFETQSQQWSPCTTPFKLGLYPTKSAGLVCQLR